MGLGSILNNIYKPEQARSSVLTYKLIDIAIMNSYIHFPQNREVLLFMFSRVGEMSDPSSLPFFSTIIVN